MNENTKYLEEIVKEHAGWTAEKLKCVHKETHDAIKIPTLRRFITE